MTALARIRRLAGDPVGTGYALAGVVRSSALFDRYARLARARGIDRLYLVLSFDCDTEDDAEVVADLHRRLADLGVQPAYAVPGELLERSADIYGSLAASGAEFLNHGYTEHVYRDPDSGLYASCFFYDQLPRDTVHDDIVRGGEVVERVTGTRPAGFRVPHFGTFQRPDQLRFLHRVLREHGYRFSTSTTPLAAFRHGPVFEAEGIVEIPVSGMRRRPLTILDTWGCFEAPTRARTGDDYLAEGTAIGRTLAERGVGVLNFYGDPLHIHDEPAFFRTVESWLEVATPASYGDLLDRLP